MFLLYSQHLLIQNILYLFYWQLYFVKFLFDFVDGNLARFYKTESLYGKFIDGLFDFLIPLVYFYLPILNNQDGVNLLELKFELLITIF